jgi:transcriptional regulator with XRE-family HTH domain
MPRRSQDLPEEFSAYEQALARAMGARIRLRRNQLELSQEQVRAQLELKQVHISRSHYSRTELGNNLLRASEIVALVHALDVSCSWLLFGDEVGPTREQED